MGKKEFVVAALNLKHKTYVVDIASLSSTPLIAFNVYLFRRPQISGLMAKEALTKIPAKYSDFADVFSPDLASELLEHTEINNYAIKLVNGQQPPYGPIYNLKQVELETIKTYI